MINLQGRARTVFFIIGTAVLLFLAWYFSSLVAYILISAVLSLTGRPVVRFLNELRIGKFQLSKSVSAFIALVLLWVVFIGFFRFVIPLLVSEFEQLSTIDLNSLIEKVEAPIREILQITGFDGTVDLKEHSLADLLRQQIFANIDLSKLSGVLGGIISLLGELFVAFFAISFITYFFLTDETMFQEGILLLVPTNYEEKVRKIMLSIYELLRRYFLGLILEVIMVMVLVTLGLTIVGLGFSHAVIIGMCCGILNVIPYLGPWMGAAVGLLIGIAINIHADFVGYTLPLLGLMSLVFAIVQVLDNVLFQPLIYSSSVKAHPLEIFLVIMAAGSMAGILGMILAIPVYTIVRVIAKEFFDNFKLVHHLTKNLK